MRSARTRASADPEASRFAAEAAYADSIFRSALGDQRGAVAALERSLELDRSYAPAILSMGSVEYQRGRRARGRRLFQPLVSLPDATRELLEIIDEAGDFLIRLGAYDDGLALYRAAVKRFPDSAVLHQGPGCCAGHRGSHEEALRASEGRARAREPPCLQGENLEGHEAAGHGRQALQPSAGPQAIGRRALIVPDSGSLLIRRTRCADEKKRAVVSRRGSAPLLIRIT